MAINNYEIKVNLKGLAKKINRTYLINDKVKIKDFCEIIVTTMNGDLSHLYMLKYKDKYYLHNSMNKNNYNEIKMGTLRLCKLLLDEKDKLELTYDFGDKWVFEITIKKINKGHNEKDIVLLKGTGKGIEDDCGGSWGLEELIEDKDNNWGYDIDDFNIEAINNKLDKYYNRHN